MIKNIENKISDDYWVNKLKNVEYGDWAINEKYFTKNSTISDDQLEYFDKVTVKQPVAEFTIILAIYSALLKRYFSDFEGQVSSAINFEESNEKANPLVFSVLSNDESGFKAYLKKTKKEVQEVFSYKDYNRRSLEERLNNKKSDNITPYSLSFNSNNNDNFNKTFHLSFSRKRKEGVIICIDYVRGFVTDYVIKHFLENFKNWIINLEEYLNLSINQIPILSDQERYEVLNGFNDTKIDCPKDKTIVDLFEEQVKKTPDNIALVFEKKELTYIELDKQSNQLAHYLRETYSVQSDDLIGLKLGRSEQLLVGILGILKSGAAYVPIDINYPKERINYIQENSNCKVVIDEIELKKFSEVKEKYSIKKLKIITTSNNLAYVIYTSGTTGKPKGVMIMHQNAVAMLNWACNEFDKENFDVVYASTSHCFDLSIYEMFYPLSIGKKIKLLDNALAIRKELQQDKRILINTVPSSIRSLIDSGVTLNNVTVINLAGEAFPIDIAKKLLSTNADIRNLYGPSEDTTYSTIYKLSPELIYNSSIPIGKPISNTICYILDGNLDPLPIGVSGKLYVSGLGVARGYLNNVELTEERFISNPFVEGSRMYDTGDLAKWLPDGNIEFLGRKDTQVKIRGYRIELGEIENTIVGFSDVLQQVVVEVKDTIHEKELVAYYVSKTVIDKSELRRFLKERLPFYMVPSYYMELKTIPLTPNGKIDKQSFPEITSEALIQGDYVAPRNDIEQGLVAIWQEVLGVERIGITDNFFELGGHSLLVGQIINKVYKQLSKSITFKFFFENPIIEELSKGLSTSTYHRIPQSATKSYYPITASQHRIWILSQLEGGDLTYNMQGSVILKGNLDISKFEEAFKFLIKRHEILRTNFKVNASGELYQYIVSEDDFEFRFSEKNLTSQTKEIVEIHIKQEQDIPFDLANGLLLKGLLLKTQEKELIFSLTIHHIIGDGWSMELLISEVISVYNTLMLDQKPNLPKLEIQYKDYAVWLQSELTKEHYKTAETYWLSQFEGELPSLKSRPKVQTYNGKTLTHSFSASFLEKLTSFSKSNDATLFMTIMSGINALLYRYTNQNDIIVGTPIAGREHPDLEGQIGLYLNTLAIRTKIEESYSFLDLLAHQKTTLLSAYQHQNYPFDELVNKLDLKRDISRSVLFDVMVVLQNQAQLHNIKTDDTLDELKVEDYQVENTRSKFDISFTFVENEGLELSIEYNTDVYDDLLIDRIFTHYQNLMNQAIDNPEGSVVSIDYLTKQEKKQLLEEFNTTTVDYPKDKTIVDLFEEQVKKTPNNIALVFEERQLTYKELNEQSNQLACYLTENYDVSLEDFIGVKLERSNWLIVSFLAILKSGGAYLPIDLEYPEERISFIESDSNCKVVIDDSLISKFEKNRLQCKTRPEIKTDWSNLAYVIYTSGSTGTPKGVLIEQKNLVNLCFWHIEYYSINQSSRGSMYSGIAFDASIWEMTPYLITGATLYPISDQTTRLDLDNLKLFFKENKITHSYLPTSITHELVDDDSFSGDITVVTGGDTLKIKKTPKFKLYNNYGPTENTVVTTCFSLHDEFATSIPIGKPISNTICYILDGNLDPLPIGVSGKLYVSGLGVARGYLNNVELTEERFISNPFVEGSRMYDTGDLAKWLPDGNIEFLGRKDTQVKIRGYRIELGEIENTIVGFSDVLQQVVVEVKDTIHEKELVAYYVSKTVIDKSELRRFLKERLPFYMVPSYYMELKTIPLTPNGKIDKQSFPEITSEALIQGDYVAPRNDIEQGLVAIWQEVLGVERIGITDNFFELGGHSLLVGQIINKVYKLLIKKVTYQDFFQKPTIKALSYSINNRVESKEELENSIYFIPSIVGVTAPFSNLIKEIKLEYNVNELQYLGVNEGEGFFESIDDAAKYFYKKISQTKNTGKIIIFGYSMGGNIGFELVKLLEKEYNDIALIVVDSYTVENKINIFNNKSNRLKINTKTQNVIKEMKIDPIIMNPHFEKMITNGIKLMEEYTQKGVINSPIYIMKAKKNKIMNIENWNKYTNNRIELSFVSGDHWEAMQDKNISTYLDVLEKIEEKNI